MKENYNSNDIDKLVFDKLTIIKDIEKKGLYQDENSTIKKWEEEEGTSNMYIVQNKGYQCLPFLGVVNGMFQREGYAVNHYLNGDIYFGYYSEDERNKHGFYSYSPEENYGQITSEFYFGLWRDDLRDGHGVYLWLTEGANKEPFTDFDGADFQAFVGDVEQDIFKKGTLMTKKGEEYLVYYGTFSEDGKKEGENCLYYSAGLERVLYGTFQNDTFVRGYVGSFDDSGNLIKILEFDGRNVLTDDEMGGNLDNDKAKVMFGFRNILMSKDYFGEVYEEFANIIKFRDTVMTDIDVLNSDKYIDIMNATISYNKISINKDVQRVVEE